MQTTEQRYFEDCVLDSLEGSPKRQAYLQKQTAVYQNAIAQREQPFTGKLLDATNQSYARTLGLALQLGFEVHRLAPPHGSPQPALTTIHWQTQATPAAYAIIIAADDALATHLTESDLANTLTQHFHALQPNGLFLATIRNYDQLLCSRPRLLHPRVFTSPPNYCIEHQLWHWVGNGHTYQADSYLIEQTAVATTLHHTQTTRRAWRRPELTLILSQVGFTHIHWSATNSDYLLVSARKS